MTAPDAPDPGHHRSGCLTAIIVMCGVVLLLPGFCALITILVTAPGVLVRIVSGQVRDPQFWPIMGIWLVLWAICLLIGYLGLRLISRARSPPR